MSQVCETCGQTIKLTHKEIFSKQKLEMLQAAAEHVKTTMKNDFKNKDLAKGHSSYGNFQKLRYHGLITQVRLNGQKHRDRWLITRNGWAFLRGEIELPKYVLVKNNHIVGRADELLSVREVYKGANTIQTEFEYFDDDGKPIGLRPALRSQQGSLFNQIGLGI